MRTRKSKEERKLEVLTEARRLFQERGYAAVAVGDILEATGLSRGGFYHHFASKSDLLRSLILEEVSRVASSLLPTDDCAETPLLAVLEAGSSYLGADPGILETIDNKEDLLEYIQLLSAAQEEVLRPLLCDAIERGRLQGDFSGVEVDSSAVPAGHVADMFLAVNAYVNQHALTGSWKEERARRFSGTAFSSLESMLGAPGYFRGMRDSFGAAAAS
jgi:AcrR family transcriptional regulator